MEARWGGVADRRVEAWWARCRAVTSRGRFLVVFMVVVVVLVVVVLVHSLDGTWTL